MKFKTQMTPNKRIARFAGLLWLMMIILGLFAQFFVREKILLQDNITTTINSIIANESLFRLGFLADQLMMVCTILTSIVLYKLLYTVDKNMAKLMVIFAISGAVINMLNLLNTIAPLHLLNNQNYMKAFNASQVESQVKLYLDLYDQGYVIAQIFFMTWVLPLGILIYKSNFLPKIFGIFFMIETFFGLVSTAINFLAPNIVLETNLLIPAAIAEISFMFWLIIRGINAEKAKAILIE